MTNLFTNLSNWKVKYTCALLMFVCVGVSTALGATFTKITSLSDLTTGNYVIVGRKGASSWGILRAGTISSNKLTYTRDYNSTPPNSITTTTVSEIWYISVSGTGNSRTVQLYNAGQKKYLSSAPGNLSYSNSGVDWTAGYNSGFCIYRGSTYYLGVNKDYDYWRDYMSSTLYQSSGYQLTLYKEAPDCSADPTVGSASLNGSVSLTSFPVQTTGWDVGTNCAWSDFGFVWSSSVNTPTLESNGTASSGCTKIQKATDGTSTSTSHSITGTFNTSTSYYVRGYGKNGYASGTYQYTDVLTITPRSVEFNSNGGSAVDTKYVNSGTKVTAPSDPTKTGYNFGEWQLNSSEFDFANTNVTSNITLVATWTAKTTTVSFNQNSGTGGQTGTLTATYGSAMPGAPVTCPTRTGYNFGGYYDGSGGTGTQYYTNAGASARSWDKDAATATLYAKWTAKSFTVTWMVNGVAFTPSGSGGTDGSTSVDFGSHVATLPTAPTPPCGDKFVGWSTTNIGAVGQATDAGLNLFTTAGDAPVINAEGAVTYYAVFADYDE